MRTAKSHFIECEEKLRALFLQQRFDIHKQTIQPFWRHVKTPITDDARRTQHKSKYRCHKYKKNSVEIADTLTLPHSILSYKNIKGHDVIIALGENTEKIDDLLNNNGAYKSYKLGFRSTRKTRLNPANNKTETAINNELVLVCVCNRKKKHGNNKGRRVKLTKSIVKKELAIMAENTQSIMLIRKSQSDRTFVMYTVFPLNYLKFDIRSVASMNARLDPTHQKASAESKITFLLENMVQRLHKFHMQNIANEQDIVMHADIKIENYLMQSGKITLIDRANTNIIKTTRLLCTTISLIPPECVADAPLTHERQTKGDVFCLGMSLLDVMCNLIISNSNYVKQQELLYKSIQEIYQLKEAFNEKHDQAKMRHTQDDAMTLMRQGATLQHQLVQTIRTVLKKKLHLFNENKNHDAIIKPLRILYHMIDTNPITRYSTTSILKQLGQDNRSNEGVKQSTNDRKRKRETTRLSDHKPTEGLTLFIKQNSLSDNLQQKRHRTTSYP